MTEKCPIHKPEVPLPKHYREGFAIVDSFLSRQIVANALVIDKSGIERDFQRVRVELEREKNV